MGDINAKSILRGDSGCNRCGEMLKHSAGKPEMNSFNTGNFTFYAANGTSIIDLFIVTDIIISWNIALYTDTEVELFTGYPNR